MHDQELMSILAAAGIEPDHQVTNQVLQAILRLSTVNLVSQTSTAFTTAGSPPNYTLTPQPPLAALAAGQRFRVKFHAAGSGTSELNVSNLGAVALVQYDAGGDKVTSYLAAGQLTDIEFDGEDWVVLNPLPDVGLQVGMTIYVPGTTPPPRTIKENGALLNRADFPLLWTFAQGSGNLVADADWQIGNFSTGDGYSTFRIPDGRGTTKMGWADDGSQDAGRAIGSFQGDAIRNITAAAAMSYNEQTPSSGVSVLQNPTGAFSVTSGGGHGYGFQNRSESSSAYRIVFDASSVVPTAPVNRVQTGAYLACICYM
jgi:hypothetical protein